ncbi:MAG: peptidoglycan-associated lipoprotein Pal [Candidatus Methylomirabilia bacterium]
MDRVARVGFFILVSVFAAGALAGCNQSPTSAGGGSDSTDGQVIAKPDASDLDVVASSAPGEPRGSGSIEASPLVPPSPREFHVRPDLKDLHFDFDRYGIRPDDVTTLDENAKWMEANPDYLILIEGHADERGTNEYNQALGERRAESTKSYLIAQGVAANRITITSYGEEHPVCTKTNEACWARNRRTHFKVKAL